MRGDESLYSVIDEECNPFFISVFYYEEENVFRDEDGSILWCLNEMIHPNDILLFKSLRPDHSYIVKHRQWRGVYCEMMWV